MIDDPIVWIVAIVVIAVVVLVALWKGDVVEFAAKGLGLKFKRARKGSDAPGEGVSVLEGAKIKGSRTGDIAGVVGDGTAAKAAGRVDVGHKASIEDSEIGDIAGVRDPPPDKRRKTPKGDARP